MKKAPAEPSAWCSACVASRAKEDPHWRKLTEDAQEKGHDLVSFDFGFVGSSTAGEKTAPYLCIVDHVYGAVFAVLTGKAVSSDNVHQSDGDFCCELVQD